MTRTISSESPREEFIADSEVKAAYEAMANEFVIARALISARPKAKLSQKDVADGIETRQSAVARMENGRHAPSMTSLSRYATAVGRAIRFEIYPEAPPAT